MLAVSLLQLLQFLRESPSRTLVMISFSLLVTVLLVQVMGPLTVLANREELEKITSKVILPRYDVVSGNGRIEGVLRYLHRRQGGRKDRHGPVRRDCSQDG